MKTEHPFHVTGEIKGLRLVLYGDGEARLFFDEDVKNTYAFIDLQNLRVPGTQNRQIRKTIRTWITLQEIKYLPKIKNET